MVFTPGHKQRGPQLFHGNRNRFCGRESFFQVWREPRNGSDTTFLPNLTI
jgi:hypothetical protein